jgi:mono/diheme cytochrome c family protein
MVKIALVLGLAWLGAINRYANLPRLGPPRARRGFGVRAFRSARLLVLGPRPRVSAAAAPVRLAAYLRGEAIVALGVLACTAALGQVTPGRHVSFDRKPTSHVTLVQPRSAGSASRLGTVTPPAGDAQRGRAVFIKLRCYACHAVRGGGFPDPDRPGPDLSGAGARPSGYLVESIMNPNALVVDGPGYTDTRGLSTMPEYRETLTVGGLIDLVAYLRTLVAPTAPSGTAGAQR